MSYLPHYTEWDHNVVHTLFTQDGIAMLHIPHYTGWDRLVILSSLAGMVQHANLRSTSHIGGDACRQGDPH